MTRFLIKYSALVTLYITVSSQSEVDEASNLHKNSQRIKRGPEEYQSGIGPPTNQCNVYYQKNHDLSNQFVESGFNNDYYNPINYDQEQSKQHLEVKREPHLPFVPDFVTPVQNILKNIPGYSWVESNNPEQTYTQVIEGGQNPLRNIFNFVFGPQDTERILQTGQVNSFQNQVPYHDNNNYNNNDYSNGNYENNINRQQTNNEAYIQPSVTEAIGDNLGIYKTQYNPSYNNNHQELSTSEVQFSTSQQTNSNDQNPHVDIQPVYVQSSSFSSSFNTDFDSQQNQHTSYSNIPTQKEQRPQSETNAYPASVQSQISIDQVRSRPLPTVTIPDNTQYQFSQPTQSSFSQDQLTSEKPQEKEKSQQEQEYRIQYTTTTSKPITTRPPLKQEVTPQKITAQNEETKVIPQQAIQTLTSTPYPKTKVVESSKPPFDNDKTVPTTSTSPQLIQEVFTESRITSAAFVTSPKLIKEYQVTENNIGVQNPQPTQDNNNQRGIDFRGDALEVYGSKINNISYAALPNQTDTVSLENDNKIEPTATIPLEIKSENRFGLDSDPSKKNPTTKKPIKKCETPASRPRPNFSKPGRRISQRKCYEYIWEQQERVYKWNTKKECHRAQNETIYIAGKEGIPGQYPHMAALGWSGDSGGWIFKCTGSLISPKFVLTAAHCSETPKRDNTVLHSIPQIVRLGDRDIAEPIRAGTISVDVGIKSITIHPEFSPPRPYNDIALVELERPVTFTRHVQPACLWSNPDTSKLGNQFIGTGWGIVDTAYQTNPPPTLQKVAVNSIDSNVCNMLIQPYCKMNFCRIADHQICGVSQNGSLNSCVGDSGAPLQAKIPLSSDSEGSMHYVVGVMSYRLGCENSDLPEIYTRVSSFISWIENIVWMSDS